MRLHRKTPSSRGRGDKGAALVEFAIIMPLLFLIIFGVIEFGNAFFQSTNVRHGARETSRLVAVNYNPAVPAGCSSELAVDKQSCALVLDACQRMDLPRDTTTISLTSGDKSLGSTATVTVSKPLKTLTGFMDSFLGGKVLTSTVATRLELAGTWSNYSRTCP